MGLGLRVTVTRSGDVEMLPRTQLRLRRPRTFMTAVGVQLMSSAVRRLPSVLSQSDGAIRTGKLAASLTPISAIASLPPPLRSVFQTRGPVPGSKAAEGLLHNIFRSSENTVTVGSNLRYAAQVHHGGTIYPEKADALAIPLTPQLKREEISPSRHPQKERLFFVPHEGGKPNVFGLLFLNRKRKEPLLLYALAHLVKQKARPFLYADDEDRRVIAEELWPRFLFE